MDKDLIESLIGIIIQLTNLMSSLTQMDVKKTRMIFQSYTDRQNDVACEECLKTMSFHVLRVKIVNILLKSQ
jgi:hypothetical protein